MRCWPTLSKRENAACALAMSSSLTWRISASAAAQAASVVSRTITCSRMPNDRVRPRAAASARTAAIFSATAAGGSPQVRYTSTCSAATFWPTSEEPPKYSGG